MEFSANFLQVCSFTVRGFFGCKVFPCAKRRLWWKISGWRSFCRRAALFFCFGKTLHRKCLLTVNWLDAICIRISTDKSFWIRQVMSAAVESRVLNDKFHFDILSLLLHDFFFSQLPLFVSTVIYNSHHYTSYPYSLDVLLLSPRFYSFSVSQYRRLCGTGVPDAMMSPSPYISPRHSLTHSSASTCSPNLIRTEPGYGKACTRWRWHLLSSDVLKLEGSFESSLVSCQWLRNGNAH